ncbi:hypothetical protein HI113_01770 [Corallococcus exiguus]|nr:DUF3592 domain-containing protein [Corallococcus exiguus]NNB89459.1 hypothetical protein [Corallococcus exiguus]NNB92642.1 hypothetical protein [Corallococcus exiguus]
MDLGNNLMMLVLFFFIIPLGLMVHLLLSHELTLKLRAEGLHAHGSVVHAYQERTPDDSLRTVVEYVFHLPGGEEIHGRYEESGSLARLPDEGDPVEVLYLAHNPNRHQCVGQEVGLVKTLLWLVFMVCWMGLGGFALMKEFQNREAASKPPPSRTLKPQGEYY